MIVISLGGSIVVPDKIDTAFIKKFKDLIKDRECIIVVGGGKTARKYIEASDKFNSQDFDKDLIGIRATKLNSELIRVCLDIKSDVIEDPNKFQVTEKIMIASGHKPGQSTDQVACLIAKKVNADYVLNLSNIYYVYDKDPKFKDAKPIEELTWNDMQKIVGTKWKPGLNAPFDPIATQFCKENKIKVIISNGNDLDNLNNILNNKKSKSTIIN